MITPSNSYGYGQGNTMPNTGAYDPLMTQFLTGGHGMGYLPQSQFMTPGSYGAFRTMPNTNMGMDQAIHNASFFENLNISSRGQLFGHSPYLLGHAYAPNVRQADYLTQANRRLGDQMLSIGAGVGDFGASMGVTGATSLAATALGAGGLLSGGIGMAAGMAVGAVTSPLIDRVRQARVLQQLTNSKLIGGTDLAQTTGKGMTMTASRKLDEGLRIMSADDSIFKDEDYRQITKLGIESGMMDYSNSADQYKHTVKKLTKNFKAMMGILETADLKGLSKEMERMQVMGASQSEFSGIANAEKMYSRMVGISHKDMVGTYGQQGAMIYSQMGMTNYQGSMANMAHAAQVEQMKRLGLVSASEVSRAGGVSGMAQEMTQTMGGVQKRLQSMYLPGLATDNFEKLDKDKVSALMSGKLSFTDIMKQSGSKVNSAGKWAAYTGNEAELNKQLNDQLGPEGMQVMLFKQAQAMRKQFNLGKGEDGLQAAYQLLGYAPEMAHREAKFMSSEKGIESLQKQIEIQQRKTRLDEQYAEEQKYSVFGKLGREFKKFSLIAQKPFTAMADHYAQWSDRRENRKLGIFTGGDHELNAGFTKNSVEDWGNFYKEMGDSKAFTKDLKGITAGPHRITREEAEASQSFEYDGMFGPGSKNKMEQYRKQGEDNNIRQAMSSGGRVSKNTSKILSNEETFANIGKEIEEATHSEHNRFVEHIDEDKSYTKSKQEEVTGEKIVDALSGKDIRELTNTEEGRTTIRLLKNNGTDQEHIRTILRRTPMDERRAILAGLAKTGKGAGMLTSMQKAKEKADETGTAFFGEDASYDLKEYEEDGRISFGEQKVSKTTTRIKGIEGAMKNFSARDVSKMGIQIAEDEDFSNEHLADTMIDRMEHQSGQKFTSEQRRKLKDNLTKQFEDKKNKQFQAIKEQAMASAKGSGKADEYFVKKRKELQEQDVDAATATYDQLLKKKEEVKDSYDNISGSDWMGKGDSDNIDVLKKAASEDINNLDYYKAMITAKALNNVGDKELSVDEQKKATEQLKKALNEAGVTEDDIKRAGVDINTMSVKDIEKIMKNKGIKGAEDLGNVARDVGEDTNMRNGGLDNIIKDITTVKNKTMQTTVMGKGIDIRNTLKEAGYEGDINALMKDPDTIRRLLKKEGLSKKARSILERGLDVAEKSGGKAGAMDLIQATMDLTKKDPHTDTTKVGEDKDSDANRMLNGMSDALTNVISDQAGATKALVAYLKNNGVKFSSRDKDGGGGHWWD